MKRSVQSNQEVSTGNGKLQLTSGLKTDVKTEKDTKSEDTKSECKDAAAAQSNPSLKTTGGLFGNLSTSATAGGPSAFGQASTSTSLFGTGFKFTPASTAAGGSSVFGGASLFGSGAPAGGSLFGANSGSSLFGSGNAGGSLFSQSGSLFGGQNSMYKPAAAKNDEEGESDDENFGKGDGSPPAFGGDTSINFGDASTRPVKLTIESRPPEKSPYTKIVNVITLSINDLCLANG